MKILGKLLLFALVLKTSTGQGDFLYITDIHYDPTYGDTDESCNPEADSTRGTYGNFECDPPWALVESAVTEMQKKFPNPKFIIWGGDNGHHEGANTRYTEDYMAEIVQNVTNLLLQAYPSVPILPVLGNHDWWPKNQLPDNGLSTSDDLYDRYYDMWRQWIPNDQEKNFKRAGFFSMNLDGGAITAIVMNTNLYLSSNNAASGEDPGGQFEWLEKLLNNSRLANSKVHLITHVPVSRGIMTAEYNQRFVDIVVSNADVIHAVYGAHLHFDEFNLFFLGGEAVAFHLLLPSITPWRWSGSPFARNPTFRHLSYDAQGELQDYTQFYLDLPKANKGQSSWRQLYKFSEAYGKDKLTVKTMLSLAMELQDLNSGKWKTYFENLNVDIGAPYNKTCNSLCKNELLCAISNVQNDHFKICMNKASAATNSSPSLALILLPVTSFFKHTCRLRSSKPSAKKHHYRTRLHHKSVVN